MNEQELRDFLAERPPSWTMQNHSGVEVDKLPCYGCAHAASTVPFPGAPSGERPCCSCVRNPEREEWAKDATQRVNDSIVIGDDGHARIFDPFGGTLYNGAPSIRFPMDNYVTMDHQEQDEWLRKRPEYARPIRFKDGSLVVVKDDEG